MFWARGVKRDFDLFYMESPASILVPATKEARARFQEEENQSVDSASTSEKNKPSTPAVEEQCSALQTCQTPRPKPRALSFLAKPRSRNEKQASPVQSIARKRKRQPLDQVILQPQEGLNVSTHTVRFAGDPRSKSTDRINRAASKAREKLALLRTPSQDTQSQDSTGAFCRSGIRQRAKSLMTQENKDPHVDKENILPQVPTATELAHSSQGKASFGNQQRTQNVIRRMNVATRQAHGALQSLRTPHHQQAYPGQEEQYYSGMLKVRYNGRLRIISIRDEMDVEDINAAIRKELGVNTFVLTYQCGSGEQRPVRSSEDLAELFEHLRKQNSSIIEADIQHTD